jgi:hypothetical protein
VREFSEMVTRDCKETLPWILTAQIVRKSVLVLNPDMNTCRSVFRVAVGVRTLYSGFFDSLETDGTGLA